VPLDLWRFRVYVASTGVWKGWDYVVLPSGALIRVDPGRYMAVDENMQAFGFEDGTAEIGEEPDYDYGDPVCRVESVSGFLVKSVRLRCAYSSDYETHLYYGRIRVAVFRPGTYEAVAEFRYVDSADASAVGALVGGVVGGATTYATTRKPAVSGIAGLVSAIVGGVIGYLAGE